MNSIKYIIIFGHILLQKHSRACFTRAGAVHIRVRVVHLSCAVHFRVPFVRSISCSFVYLSCVVYVSCAVRALGFAHIRVSFVPGVRFVHFRAPHVHHSCACTFVHPTCTFRANPNHFSGNVKNYNYNCILLYLIHFNI